MHIWSTKPSVYKLKPTTRMAIQSFEDKNRIKLPQEYTNLLLVQNGGEIIYNAFPTIEKTNWASDHISIEFIFGLGEGQNSISYSPYYIKEWDLPTNIVLFSGTGHEWVAFDYRQTKENPPIIYIEVDTNKILTLAEDFHSFIQGLYVHEYDDDDYEYEDDDNDDFNILDHPEKLKEIFSDINQYTMEELSPYIHSFPGLPDQKYIITMFILGMNHLDVDVREDLCTTLYALLMEQEIVEKELLENFIKKAESDKYPHIIRYAQYLKNYLN